MRTLHLSTLSLLTLAGALPPGEAAALPFSAAIQPEGVTPAPFASLPLAMEPVEGGADFAALRTHSWTLPDGTRRLSLERDVRLRLAGYDLTARRASVWIADRPDLLQADAIPVVQVFVYAEGVDTPLSDASVAVTAPDLRIQGVIRLTQPLTLGVDAVIPAAPDTGPVSVFEARARMALSDALATNLTPVVPAPLAEVPRPEIALDAATDRAAATAATDDLEPPLRTAEPIIEPEGYVTLAAERITRTLDGDQPAVILAGGVSATYTIPGQRRVLEMTAQSAVVFLKSDDAETTGLGSVQAGNIDGIYLEGDVVATDAGYSIRGPRVFYDVANDKAIVLDAVFSTYDLTTGSPLYVRARSVRQVTRDEFVADRARLSNTAFARPNITLGARTVTIRQTPRDENEPEGPKRTLVDAKGINLTAGTMPIAWLPRFKGDPERIPLKEVSLVNVTDSGAEIRTRWDLITLLGQESKDWLEVDLLADALFERGPGVGVEATWKTSRRRGGLLTYWVFNDTGTDVLTSGARIDRDSETRGIVRAENLSTLNSLWQLRTEIAHVSDPAFTDSFFTGLSETGREFQTRLHLLRTEENAVFTFEVAGQIDDFSPNEYLLQSQGYSVQRFPEATYTRLADDVIPALPGLITYSSQSRVGVLKFRLSDATPAEFGFTSNARAQRAFGINANQRFSDVLGAQGYSEDYRFRFDTRHEIAAHFNAGPVQITPWVVGRVTAYDNDFNDFGPGTGDETRVWQATGITLSTLTQRVIDGVHSSSLDVNRLRHIVKPSFTFFNAVTSVDQDELPVYDESVESLANGNVVRIALDQTLQTKRGGPGRWYNVDWLTLDAEMVFSSDDAIGESSIGRYDEAQPELSRLSDFAAVSSTWQATDAVAVVGGTIYDMENGLQSVTTAGVLIDHHPGLMSYVRYRRLHDQDSTLLSTGLRYDLTEKYNVNTAVTFDTQDSGIQDVSAEILRDFQSAVFGVSATYSNISESTSLSVVFQPLGRGSAARVGGNPTAADNRTSALGG